MRPISKDAQVIQAAVTNAMLPQVNEKLANPQDCKPFTRDNLIAAALRAAADQVTPTTTDPRVSTIRYKLLRIARELDGGDE